MKNCVSQPHLKGYPILLFGGAGDTNKTTVLSFGTNPNAKYPTYYFRYVFNLTVVPSTLKAAVFGMVANPGAVAYINQIEVGRKNLGGQKVVQ
jgi:hypothetical protein